MTDPMDQPEEDTTYGLVYPFTVCRSQGGPYEDESFVAGVQLGHIDRILQIAAGVGADRVRSTARTALVPQLELCGMARGFPVVTVEEVTATDKYPAMPEWVFITFTTGKDAT